MNAEKNQFDWARLIKRLFGAVCVAIGLALLSNLLPAIGDILGNSSTARDYRAIWAFGLCGLLLLAFGGVMLYNPDLLKE
ncbi:hypothetical protein SAMN05660284_02142 [Formivibrio citricus]|uniref:Uncharacterized protein n=1 Tax=Formivibrio citricus TaxID=83765 RepID=A0A1I5BFA0_9NEIS|nr:hypothetical protein [Formivibrio citricus]SFN73356.1 hypothetical protein SAMN05660284_02142 [Formivibrio citricus]